MTVGLLAREDAPIGGGVLTLGLNHQTAPLELRERLAFSPERIIPTLRDFHGRFGLAAAANESGHSKRTEAALLSTCNRTELYFGAHPELTEPALGWLAALGGVSQGRLAEHAYILQGPQAARHAFRVASGLDSMVLGEPQILGQLKQAVREAGTAGTLGSTLNQLFQRSFSVAKEVRTATEIGSHSISMAAAAVRLASQLFEDLADTRVLFVGAGEMIELAATHFAAREPRHIAVANRTLERAEKLSQRFGAEAVRLADLPSRLAEFDIVVSCTASSLPIIGLGAVERALKLRKHRPMFMVDLAVPRDIEPEVADLGDIYLYTVDDLSEVVQTAGEKRQAAVAQAEAIIETGVRGFQQWLDQRSAVPLIQALQAQTNSWRDRELSRARRQLARGESVDTVLDALSRGLMQKMLHGALAELNHADPADRARLAETVSRLFLRASPTSVAASAPEDDHR